MKRFRLVAATAALVLVATAASAQSSVNGRVTNAQGAAIATADVTLRVLPAPGAPAMARMPNMPGMASPERTTQSRADGSFGFDQVPTGQYVLFVDYSGFERSSQEIQVSNQPRTVTVVMQPLELAGEPVAALTGGAVDSQLLLDRIKTLEQRISDLEAGTVLSEPETRVKRIEVYTDANGNMHDEPVPGAKKAYTYQRERVYRRQSLGEKLEQAIADNDAKKITVGVSAASVTQVARQSEGAEAVADDHAYQLSSADLFFSAGLAQYTSFFADIVGLTGAPPDAEIPTLTLLNSYTARLVRQNEINLREAWVRTELFGQKLALSAGRLDLTNYFDRNAFANDETSQFISDALVNNPALGLSTNGTGVAAVYDPKHGVILKAGFQQSNNDATNLSQSLYTLAEADYVARPPGLSEGSYRLWVRYDNTSANHTGFGVSLDQKFTPYFGVFGRYGNAEADAGHNTFYSLGFQIQNALVVSPSDFWGFGYAQSDLEAGDRERMAEAYYNFEISEKLRLSFHLQHAFESPTGASDYAFFLPVIRLQASF